MHHWLRRARHLMWFLFTSRLRTLEVAGRKEKGHMHCILIPSTGKEFDSHFLNSSKGGHLGRCWGQILTKVMGRAQGSAATRTLERMERWRVYSVD